MEFIVQRLGKDVTLDDAKRLAHGEYNPLLKMYGFNVKMPRTKEGRAQVFVQCLNSRPEDTFFLTDWKDIPFGTVFLPSQYDPHKKKGSDYLFATVTGNSSKPRQVKLELVRTDYSAGFKIVKQNDRDILVNRGYKVCENARPSSAPHGKKIFMRLKIDSEQKAVKWTFFSPDQELNRMWGSTPEKYDARKHYHVFLSYHVDKSWSHPWLDISALRDRVKVERAENPSYNYRKSNSCALAERAIFKAQHARHLEDHPPPGHRSSAALGDVLGFLCERGDLPPASCTALARTSKAIKEIVAPYVRNSPLAVSDRRRGPLLRAISKIQSPRKIFGKHVCSWMVRSFSHYSSHRPEGVAVYETGFMPYETPFLMKLAIGYTKDQLIAAEGLHDLRHFLRSDGRYVVFGVYQRYSSRKFICLRDPMMPDDPFGNRDIGTLHPFLKKSVYTWVYTHNIELAKLVLESQLRKL